MVGREGGEDESIPGTGNMSGQHHLTQTLPDALDIPQQTQTPPHTHIRDVGVGSENLCLILNQFNSIKLLYARHVRPATGTAIAHTHTHSLPLTPSAGNKWQRRGPNSRTITSSMSSGRSPAPPGRCAFDGNNFH